MARRLLGPEGPSKIKGPEVPSKVNRAAGLFKIGNQLFTAEGPKVVEKVADTGAAIFLDLKFHDIPNTVAGAVASAAALPRVKMLTVHTTGGLAMMRAAREAAGSGKKRPMLLGVTILTSIDAQTMQSIGLSGTTSSRAVALARLAQQAGLDGVVSSAHEVAAIREACGKDFLIVVPGIRPADASVNDQSRVATPWEAIRAGASYLVVGRPITAASDPRKAALSILEEIEAAGAARLAASV